MWIQPKTDWKWKSVEEGDYFNISDYNRIKGNIDYLYDLALAMYPEFEYEQMGTDKNYADYPYADEINKLADNLANIVEGSYPVNIGSKVTYVDNGPFIGYEDLNRIETACVSIHNLLTTQKKCIPKLSITLGINKIGGL